MAAAQTIRSLWRTTKRDEVSEVTTDNAWVRRHPAYRAVVRGWPERALLACSGGVDSSALLVLAGIGVRRGDIGEVVVAHVDHQTREESASEGMRVAQLAGRFGLEAVRLTVSAEDAAAASSSPEDRLRAQRYAVLARAAAERGIETVVTAHTRDDQIETILMRLLGGTGGLALAGMAPRSAMETLSGTVQIARPLLAVSRAQLEDVLRRTNVTPVEDPSNLDRRYRRNALRQDIIPLLSESFPGFESALLRSAALASRDAAALDAIAADVIATGVRYLDGQTLIDRELLRESQPAVATRVIRWAAGRLMPDNQREFSFERIESVRLAIAGRTGAVIELPYDIIARIERSEVVFERRNI
jgi:tRNA(Ile)-lysidine synthase